MQSSFEFKTKLKAPHIQYSVFRPTQGDKGQEREALALHIELVK